MCGIVGYVGHQEAWPLIFSGLQRLEYRGYDRASVAFLIPSGKLHVQKSIGKVKELNYSRLLGRALGQLTARF